MVAYKLFHRRRDGTLGPLFINRREVIPVGEWVDAHAYPTKGYAYRPGWHCTSVPHAPHLKLKHDRVWMQVEVEDVTPYDRPESQGGTWILARRLKVVGEPHLPSR